MTERPIIFSGAMVRAILAGTKTQTRRVVTRSNSFFDGSRVDSDVWNTLDFASPAIFVDKGPSPAGNHGPYLHVPSKDDETRHRVYPQWQRGDRLWVRETWAEIETDEGRVLVYAADQACEELKRWRSPIHLRRSCCRILLEIVDVWMQRVQAISEEDALAEGVRSQVKHSAAFADLWDSINAKRGYGLDVNPGYGR
jgi:hypothetical protein